MRKYWKDQKYTDKYLCSTFRKRECPKMKTRRNKSQHTECLQKLNDMKQNTQIYLTELIKFISCREKIKRNILLLQNYNYELKLCSTKAEKTRIEREFKELSKHYTERLDKPPKSLIVDKLHDSFHYSSDVKHYEKSDNHKPVIVNNGKIDKHENEVKKKDIASGSTEMSETVAYKKNNKKKKEDLNLVFPLLLRNLRFLIMEKSMLIG